MDESQMELFWSKASVTLNSPTFGILILIIALLILIITSRAHQTNIQKNMKQIELDIAAIQKQVEFIHNYHSTIDENFSSSQKELTDLGKTIKLIQNEIGSRNDEMVSEQKINIAIDMAKLGATAEEISSKTGLDTEQIETIIRFHTSTETN
tara:strand:+ start:131 stop:586 length:456 start_codon:yes stop_codon:yes gene_type:complete